MRGLIIELGNPMQDETVSGLIEFLRMLSPMPADDDLQLDMARVRGYEETIRAISALLEASADRDSRLIPALIASFGYGDGHGLYWSTLSILEKFPVQLLHSALHQGVKSDSRGTRMWCAFMLGRIRDEQDVPLLISLLNDSEPLVKYNAILALQMIGDPQAINPIAKMLGDENAEVKRIANQAITALVQNRTTT